MEAQRRKTAVALLSVVSNTVLVAGKLTIGLMIGSVSVISEAMHSAVDLVASGIALFAVRTAHKPADEEHAFGHGKIESISGAIEALLIFAAAGWIIYEAARKFARPEPIEAVSWGIAVMAASAIANTVVSTMLFRVGRETESIALMADGWHLRTDVYTSAGVMLGLGLIWLTERLFAAAHFHWIDPLAAVIVALLIVRAAWRLTLEAARDLLDHSLPADEATWLEAYLGRPRDGVRGIHKLRTRRAGAVRFVEFHLLVDKTLSVATSHAITDAMTDEIAARFPGASVTIHVEPSEGRAAQVGRPPAGEQPSRP